MISISTLDIVLVDILLYQIILPNASSLHKTPKILHHFHLAPQNAHPPPRAYQKPHGSGIQPSQACKNERLMKKEKAFTPIRISYASLFQRLKQLYMLKPIQIKMPNPLSEKFDVSQRFTGCLDAPGHDTEKCWSLKRAIKKLIDASDIVVQNTDASDTSQSPSPVHNEMHILECENYFGSFRGTSVAKLSTLSKVDLRKEPAKGTQKQSVKNNVMKACEVGSVIDVEPND